MLVDDYIFCGSLNVADPYTGTRYGDSSFRDLNCYVQSSEAKRVLKFFEDIIMANEDQIPAGIDVPKLFKECTAEFEAKWKE